MDIKLLLLKSLSLKKPISGSHRIYYGKLCFVIKYVINGKVLSIQSIKNSKKITTWSQRIKHYNTVYKLHRVKHSKAFRTYKNLLVAPICSFEDKNIMTDDFYSHTQGTQTDTFKILLATAEISSQTLDVQKHTKEVQTEPLKITPKVKKNIELGSTTKMVAIQNQAISLTTTAQQTIACAKFIRNMAFVNKRLTARNSSKLSQTDSYTECKGIQCKRATQTKATNTVVHTTNSSTQAQNELQGVSSAVPATKSFPLPAKDFEVFIYMLNEIGETVVNQNQILTNNNEIMKQIMQTNKQIDSECEKPSCSSISTQTEQPLRIEVKNNFSQTKENCTKPRKLLLFKGLYNQHSK